MAARAQKNPQILQDIYEILEVDPDGKKFDKGTSGRCMQGQQQLVARCLFPLPPPLTPPPPSVALAVSRIKARGDLYEMDLVLDMNVDLYPVAQGEKLSICLATTLNVDGSAMLSDLDTREQLYDQVSSWYNYLLFGGEGDSPWVEVHKTVKRSGWCTHISSGSMKGRWVWVADSLSRVGSEWPCALPCLSSHPAAHAISTGNHTRPAQSISRQPCSGLFS